MHAWVARRVVTVAQFASSVWMGLKAQNGRTSNLERQVSLYIEC